MELLTVLLFIGLGILALIVAMRPLYMGFIKKPTHTPQDFLKQTDQNKMPVIVCAGDSMTQGLLSYDYVSALRNNLNKQYEIVNAGRNGDTAAGLIRRAEEDIIACKPQLTVILIGTNDARLQSETAIKSGIASMRELLTLLKSKNSGELILVSIPPLGEALDAPVNKLVSQYNHALKALAVEYKATYIPFYETLSQAIKTTTYPLPPASFTFSVGRIIKGAYQHFMFSQSFSQIASSNNLAFLTDQVHLSKSAGEILVALLTDRLQS